MKTRIVFGLMMLTVFAGLVALDAKIGHPFPILHVLFLALAYWVSLKFVRYYPSNSGRTLG